VVSLGTQCQNAAAGASPQICNGQRGIVLFTGITVAAPTGRTSSVSRLPLSVGRLPLSVSRQA